MNVLCKKYTRRDFLFRFTTLLFSITGLAGTICNTAICPLDSTVKQVVSKLVKAAFIEPSSVVKLGSVYLHKYPHERNLNTLVNAIISENTELEYVINNDKPFNIKEALKHQIKKEFEYGRVVNIDGWILSQTEARLSALTNFA